MLKMVAFIYLHECLLLTMAACTTETVTKPVQYELGCERTLIKGDQEIGLDVYTDRFKVIN